MATFMFSKEPSRQLVEQIQKARESDKGWFELFIVAYGDGESYSPEDPVVVRETRSSQSLADGRDILYFESQSGHEVKVILPPADPMSLLAPAEILLD